MSDLNKERKKAVRGAWKQERAYVRKGKGTRDWSLAEQREIVAKGKVTGYEGHHMKSVKAYPEFAGDPNNIQFLSHSEHIHKAHKRNTKNPTNGYYDPKTGKVYSFYNGKPKAPKAQQLSKVLTPKQQDLAIKREQARKQAAVQAKSEKKQAVTKQSYKDPSLSNKGLKSYQEKISNNQQESISQSGKSTNHGLQSYQSKANGKSGNSGQGKGSFGGGKLSGGSGAPSSGRSGGASSGGSSGAPSSGGSRGASSGGNGGQSSGGGKGR